MAVVVVGGHTRNIGKTSVVAGLIAALPEFRWTAVKITQYGHGICSANGEACDCATADHTLAVSEERLRDAGTDSSRYLGAGAAHSWWVRTQQGELHEAMPRVRKLVEAAENTIIESNSVLRFLKPDLGLSVLDPRVADFKPSALRYLDRVDALVMPVPCLDSTLAWKGVSAQLIARQRRFGFVAPEYCPPDLVAFVRERLQRLARPAA
jgi:hypothetical protein